jgi:hypothetical protein
MRAREADNPVLLARVKAESEIQTDDSAQDPCKLGMTEQMDAPKFNPFNVILIDPVAAELCCRTALADEESNVCSIVVLAEIQANTVNANLEDALELCILLHDTADEEIQFEASESEKTIRAELEKEEIPKNEPKIDTLDAPDIAPFTKRTILAKGEETEKICEKDARTLDIVNAVRELRMI